MPKPYVKPWTPKLQGGTYRPFLSSFLVYSRHPKEGEGYDPLRKPHSPKL